MQPLKITIRGNFWDSQIYKGRLYLWDMENTLRVLDWDELVASFDRGKQIFRLPLECGFSRGNLLYRVSDVSVVFGDKEIRAVIKKRFELGAAQNWEIELSECEPFELGVQNNPVLDLPDDTAIYFDNLYSLTSDGLFSVEVHKNRRNVYMVDRDARKQWDGQGLAMQVGSGNLAVAAGSDGLFECDLKSTHSEPHNVSPRHTLFPNYLFASIYGSSDVAHGFLAAYKWEEAEESVKPGFRRNTLVRKFARIVDEDGIFSTSKRKGLTFGSQEKLYRVTGSLIQAVNFAQKWAAEAGEEDQAFRELESLKLANTGAEGEPLSGGVASFGLVTEFDNGLIVVKSDQTTLFIPGPITRWRVFPRSVRYENQLHVITNDSLDIYSFNHDYFIDQIDKNIGTRFKAKETRSDFASSIFDEW